MCWTENLPARYSVTSAVRLARTLPSVMSMGPTLPDPGKPDLPSTPSYSSVKVIPAGSGCDTIALSHAFLDIVVKNLTCSGHTLYGCVVTIVFATLRDTSERVR